MLSVFLFQVTIVYAPFPQIFLGLRLQNWLLCTVLIRTIFHLCMMQLFIRLHITQFVDIKNVNFHFNIPKGLYTGYLSMPWGQQQRSLERAHQDQATNFTNNSTKKEPLNCINYCSNMHKNNEGEVTKKIFSFSCTFSYLFL